jgi:putative hydrolase of the HAD superfamily
MSFRAVLFDLGGVVLGSPFTAIFELERRYGLGRGFITRHIAQTGEQGAFSRLERGELDVPGFGVAFAAECRKLGVALDGTELITCIAAGAEPRPRYLRALERIREHGILTAALTNNWKNDGVDRLAPKFDAFFESAKLGMRKPDPRIYVHACESLGVKAVEVVYLDDIGKNLKPARELGMTTLLVSDGDAALDELSGLLDFAL